jgi:hypothetical protein
MKVLTYAQLAQSAYSAKPNIGNQDGSARIIFTTTGDGLCVSVPGTNNFATAKADVDVDILKTENHGRVHSGFYNAYLTIKDKTLHYPPRVLTAHSEGCGIITHLAVDLCLIGQPPEALICFESPNISVDTAIKDILDKFNVKRLYTKFAADLVADVPFSLIEHWQVPSTRTMIGTSWESRLPIPLDNISDHAVANEVKWYTDNPTEI